MRLQRKLWLKLQYYGSHMEFVLVIVGVFTNTSIVWSTVHIKHGTATGCHVLACSHLGKAIFDGQRQ